MLDADDRAGERVAAGVHEARREVRGDLTESEARLLVRTVFPLVNQAVEAAEGNEGPPV